MTIIEGMVVVSLVISLFSLIIMFLTFLHVLTIKNQVNQIYVAMSTLLGRVFSIEAILNKMSQGFTEFIRLTDNMMGYPSDDNKIIYKTADGRYTAKSIDELVEKIKKDGNSDEYFTDDELDKLKKLFDPEDDDNEED